MPILSEEIQLGYALEAFGWAHNKGIGWATAKLICFKTAGITSMADLATGCKDQTINLDLELFGVPQEEQLTSAEMEKLKSFLPGPRGFRCFRLAQMAANNVRKGTADTSYVHRPYSGKIGEEKFKLSAENPWILHVDCAGFVRNCLKHVTKDPFVMSLSDRSFMRAKDFYSFFENIPYTVMDETYISESDRRMKWRIVNDLRMVIPGDIICYRPAGNAAGGAAFTEDDRKDLNFLLRCVRTAQLWRSQDRKSEWGNLVTTNVARDPRIKSWAELVKKKLNDVGIKTVKDVYLQIDEINNKLREKNYTLLKRDTLRLMKECAETTCKNTGHIVFVSGPAVAMGNDIYRVRVVHSTSAGCPDKDGRITQGVEEYYRRFKLTKKNGKPYWTRPMKKVKNPIIEKLQSSTDTEATGDETNDDEEDDEDDPDDEVVIEMEKPVDELAGQGEVEVIAARMCF